MRYTSIRFNVLLALGCSLVLASGTGCSPDDGRVPTSSIEGEASDTEADPRAVSDLPDSDFPSLEPAMGPSGAVAAIEKAYEARSIELLDRLFNPDVFQFIFDPIDVMEDLDLPPSWDWQDERRASLNLFTSQLVVDIEVEFQASAPVEASPGDAAPPGSWRIDLTESRLVVTTDDPLGGDPIVYRVEGDRATLFVRPDEDSSPEYWRIVEWRDHRVDVPGTVEVDVSWGVIKGLYQ